MIERFRLVETNWSRSFGPEASGLEFQHWSRNFGIIQFVHSWLKAKSCQLSAISKQLFLAYKSKFIPKFRDKNR